MVHLPGKQKKQEREESPRGGEQQQNNLFSALSKPLNDVAKPFKAVGSGMKGIGKGKTPDEKRKEGGPSPFGAIQAAIGPVSGGSKALFEGVRNISSQTKKKGRGTGNQQETVAGMDDGSGGPESDAAMTAMIEPDKQLESMNVIFKKSLKGVRVQDWYETCWSEKEPFYGPWLSESGKNDVRVEEWTFANENEPILGDWDKENYHQTRKVTFSMERSSGLYSGSTTTNVTHTQFCRVEDNNRCVVTTSVRMTGIPFADAFYVVIRWVGSSQGSDLLVEVGLFVVFVKQVIVSGQIRSGTTQQTTQTQLDLFRRMKATLCPSDENAPVSEDGGEEVAAVARASPESQPPLDMLAQKLSKMFSLCFPFWIKPEEDEDGDDIDSVMKAIHVNLRVIRGLPATGNVSGDGTDLKYVTEEFESAQEALDKCLMKFISKSKSDIEKPANEDDDAAIPATSTSSSSSAEKFFSSMMRPLQRVASLGESGSKKSSQLRERLLGSPKKSKDEDSCVPTNGPDKVLEAMNVVIDKEIPNASIKEIYDSCISETKPFYRPWLEELGATEVKVEDWVFAKEGEKGFSDDWSEETYSQKRKVTYSINRKTVVGHEIETEVTQNHYCRFEGDKKLILQVTMDTSGVPFGDAHTDHIRHVYTQSDDDGAVLVKVGVFVMLRKGTKTVLLSQKVRVDASKEATKRQMQLFRSVRAAVGAATSDSSVEKYVDVQREIDKMQPFHCIKLPLQSCLSRTQRLSHMYPDGLLEDIDSVSEQLNLVDTKVRAIEPFLEGRPRGEDSEMLHFVLNELELVDQALDNIIVWHGDQVKGKEALNRASFE